MPRVVMLERPRQQSQGDEEGMIRRGEEEMKSIPKLVRRPRSTYVQKGRLGRGSFARQGVRDCVNSQDKTRLNDVTWTNKIGKV
jgi:hypothetical protein